MAHGGWGNRRLWHWQSAFSAIVYLTAPEAPGPDLARSRNSAKGVYSLTIAPEAGEPRQGELHAWVVTVKTRQGAPVEDATITIDGGMPEHSSRPADQPARRPLISATGAIASRA